MTDEDGVPGATGSEGGADRGSAHTPVAGHGHSLPIGSVARIPLRLHWTFVLLLAFVVAVDWTHGSRFVLDGLVWIVALFASVDVPIVHFSVLWWNTLHQGATVLNPNLSPTIHGSMAWTLLLGFVALTLVFVWMLLVRYRIGVMEDWLGSGEMDMALTERRAEGVDPDGSADRAAGGRAPGVGASLAPPSAPAVPAGAALLSDAPTPAGPGAPGGPGAEGVAGAEGAAGDGVGMLPERAR